MSKQGTRAFLRGFVKKAKESNPFGAWQEVYDEAQEERKNLKRSYKPDPVAISRGPISEFEA